MRNIEVIAWTTLIFGILLFLADKRNIGKKLKNDLTIKNIAFIGLAQTLALVPGVSRSGIVITTGRFLKFNRVDAAKISFFNNIINFNIFHIFIFNNKIFIIFFKQVFP